MYEKSTGYVFLALVFVMMCVLRLWFTLYLVFAIALVLTTLHKKRSYCRHMCPIALAQDAAYQKKDRFRTFDAGTMRRVSTGFVLVFWALLLGLSLYHLYEKTGNLRKKNLVQDFLSLEPVVGFESQEAEIRHPRRGNICVWEILFRSERQDAL